jgi:hypothetical protein
VAKAKVLFFSAKVISKRWLASFTLEDDSRKELYRKTRQEAHKALQQMLHDAEQGTLATGPQQTVKQFLEYWLESADYRDETR